MRNDIIKKIELDLGGKIVRLTPEQAKKLKSALNELFGEKEKEYIPYPQPYPVEPVRPWRWEREWWDTAWPKDNYYMTTGGVTCSVGSDSDTLKLTI